MHNLFLEEAISKYKTPFYVFDIDALVNQVNKIRSIVSSNIELCYAMKANPFIIKEIENVIDSFEVCSPGEFHICEKASISMDKVIMSGVYKNAKDIEYVFLNYGNRVIYTVESLLQWHIMKQYSQKHNISFNVLLRLTSGNQFGINENDIYEIISERDLYPNIEIEGIQFFSGTQKKSSSKIIKEIDMLDNFCNSLEKKYGFVPKRLEYGPGLPIFYFGEDNSESDILIDLNNRLENMRFKGKIILEIGRFIAAYCGSYVTSVVDIKSNHNQNYCIVDGGMHHINYYGQVLAMKKPPIVHWSNQKNGNIKEWTICGALCTVNDLLVKQYSMDNLHLDDKLIFEKVGAYSVTEGISLFLSRELPQVILYSKENGFKLVRNNFPTEILNYNTEEIKKEV